MGGVSIWGGREDEGRGPTFVVVEHGGLVHEIDGSDAMRVYNKQTTRCGCRLEKDEVGGWAV